MPGTLDIEHDLSITGEQLIVNLVRPHLLSWIWPITNLGVASLLGKIGSLGNTSVMMNIIGAGLVQPQSS